MSGEAYKGTLAEIPIPHLLRRLATIIAAELRPDQEPDPAIEARIRDHFLAATFEADGLLLRFTWGEKLEAYPRKLYTEIAASLALGGLRAVAQAFVESLAPAFIPEDERPAYFAAFHTEHHAAGMALVDLPALLALPAHH